MNELGSEGGIDYGSLLQKALLQLVREVLLQVARDGLQGSSHLVLTFSTRDPMVDIPLHLRARFADQMTIILEHQFWNLNVEDESFSVTLKFGGRPERLRIPLISLLSFVDPSVPFALQLRPQNPEAKSDQPAAVDPATSPEPTSARNVVSLGAYREATRRRPPTEDASEVPGEGE